MLHAQNLFYIHILYTQKGVYNNFEYKTNFEREAFRFSMIKRLGILRNDFLWYKMKLSGIILVKVRESLGNSEPGPDFDQH